MLIVDANVIVSVLVGVRSRQELRFLRERDAILCAPSPQYAEVHSVLTKKIGIAAERAASLISDLGGDLRRLDPDEYAAFEATARARLHARAQPDWPVLAAALAYDGAIWSNDRDFFGVGVPVWSSRNVRFAAA